MPPDGWGINLIQDCGCSGTGTGPVLPWMCWGHSGAYETLARVQGSASHPSGAAWGKGCRQGPGGQQQVLAASGGSTMSGWASGPGGSSSGRFEPQWVHVRHVIFNLSLSPHCETHSMSLLNTTDPQAGGPMLTAGGSGEHREQEGALCLALSWGAQDSRGVHEALGSQFLSMVPCQAQPSGSGGSWGCRIPCWGC